MNQNKFRIFLLIVACFLNYLSINAQDLKSTISADDVIKKVINAIDQYPAISYNVTKELKYPADNYHYIDTTFFYMQHYEPSILGIRFISKSIGFSSVYNGKQYFGLDNKDKTIDSNTIYSLKSMNGNSILKTSFTMLKQRLQIVLSDIGFTKSVSDTMLNGKLYWKVSFEKKDSYFGSLSEGLQTFQQKAELHRFPYELVIDKVNFLPILFIIRTIKGNDGRDFIKMTYDDVNTNPKPPPVESWEYDFYTKNYKPYVPELKKEEVKTGTMFTGFLLNEYSPKSNQLVPFSKYKGKVVLLEFWFKTCGPCMEAMPQYNDLQSSFPKDSFQLVTINVEDKKDDIAFFYKKYKPSFPMLYNAAAMFKDLGFSACPKGVLINKEGVIVKKYAGFNAAKLKTDIAEALK